MEDRTIRVFLSWSGEPSKAIADALRKWLPKVLQNVKPWMSSTDIYKGARWANDVAQELSGARFGVLCMTPGNLGAPWVMFEAGALSKHVGRDLVTPFLVGVEPSALEGPLAQFQATRFDRTDMLNLLRTMNAQLEQERVLDSATLEDVFQKWWPDLEAVISAISLESSEPNPPRRSERELLEELVELARAQERRATDRPVTLRFTSRAERQAAEMAAQEAGKNFPPVSISNVDPELLRRGIVITSKQPQFRSAFVPPGDLIADRAVFLTNDEPTRWVQSSSDDPTRWVSQTFDETTPASGLAQPGSSETAKKPESSDMGKTP